MSVGVEGLGFRTNAGGCLQFGIPFLGPWQSVKIQALYLSCFHVGFCACNYRCASPCCTKVQDCSTHKGVFDMWSLFIPESIYTMLCSGCGQEKRHGADTRFAGMEAVWSPIRSYRIALNPKTPKTWMLTTLPGQNKLLAFGLTFPKMRNLVLH